MRSGRLLAEESPQTLLTMYRCTSLEDVFLKLSRKQGQSVNGPTELNIRCVVGEEILRPVYLNLVFYFFCSNNISLSALAFGSKKDNPVYVSQESGVVGLNFHQSKEVLISDTNGSTYNVSVCFNYVFLPHNGCNECVWNCWQFSCVITDQRFTAPTKQQWRLNC
jgi:hypothetical protein